jgi:6-pyruvoyltetrahydropterin/6-carboxytetrahydropterin synthase
MTTLIAKEFRWEMAHRLADHAGLCRNPHGHSYRMLVELEAEPNASGMIMDFGDVKAVVAPLVEHLDHAFLCDRADAVMAAFLEQNGFKTVFINAPTTTENLAAWLLNELALPLRSHAALHLGLKRLRVRVYETSTAFAEVEARF